MSLSFQVILKFCPLPNQNLRESLIECLTNSQKVLDTVYTNIDTVDIIEKVEYEIESVDQAGSNANNIFDELYLLLPDTPNKTDSKTLEHFEQSRFDKKSAH